jgi:hypothetical protein
VGFTGSSGWKGTWGARFAGSGEREGEKEARR